MRGAVREWLRGRLRAGAGAAPSVPASERRGAEPADAEIVRQALPYTMCGSERLVALVEAVRYCVRAEIPGALAECGVWRGGSMLAVALTLRDAGVSDRDLYLFDSFEGMPAPSELDTSALERPALESWRAAGGRPWPELFDREDFSEEAVGRLLVASGYPAARVHSIRGLVEETIPARAPGSLALLRLDTDWYESTRHELEHLYPRLSPGGVLIVDDYGHWDGCRRAVDEYFRSQAPPVLLQRIDYSARIAVKR